MPDMILWLDGLHSDASMTPVKQQTMWQWLAHDINTAGMKAQKTNHKKTRGEPISEEPPTTSVTTDRGRQMVER